MKKTNYIAPELEVIYLTIERGFAQSDNYNEDVDTEQGYDNEFGD